MAASSQISWIDAVSSVSTALDEITKIQQEDVRASLDAKIKEVWTDAAIKDYEASITDQYRLRLTKKIGSATQPVVGASTGEKQVLALSFVASLVDKARENYTKHGPRIQGVSVGGQYPLVMDSPFGSLEDEYRAKVAEWLPTLADQVVVMVSNSQWRGEVESAMKSRIGCEYVLELHTLKRGANKKIVVGDSEYDYVVSSPEPVEKTIIRRVGNEE